MSNLQLELVGGPLRSMRRAMAWWSVGMAALVVLTLLFWPIFKGSTGITDALNHLPGSVLAAFGLQDFGSPSGYLRANLYEILVPILLVAVAVTLVGGQTASEEAGGRLELYLAQPVRRLAVYFGRAVAAFIGLLVVTLVMAVVQVAMDAVVNLPIDLGNLVSTILLDVFLATFFGSLAFAIACARPRPSVVIGAGIELAVLSYMVVALFSFSSTLEPWSRLSPWSWALAGNPLEHGADLWRFVALAVPSILLVLLGLRAVARRDIAAG